MSTILDTIADYARIRVAADKERVSPDARVFGSAEEALAALERERTAVRRTGRPFTTPWQSPA